MCNKTFKTQCVLVSFSHSWTRSWAGHKSILTELHCISKKSTRMVRKVFKISVMMLAMLAVNKVAGCMPVKNLPIQLPVDALHNIGIWKNLVVEPNPPTQVPANVSQVVSSVRLVNSVAVTKQPIDVATNVLEAVHPNNSISTTGPLTGAQPTPFKLTTNYRQPWVSQPWHRHNRQNHMTGGLMWSLTPFQKVVSYSNEKFATRLYNNLNTAYYQSNLITSPFSTHAILAMLYTGAAGNTLIDMAKTLFLPRDERAVKTGFRESLQELEKTLDIANKIYISNTVNVLPSFLQTAQQDFLSDVENLDLTSGIAAGFIDSWISEKTQDHISDVISPNDLDKGSKIVLINVAYFKTNWKKKFNPIHTKKRPFFISNNSTVDVDMMQVDGFFAYINDEIDDLVLLPYDVDTSMVVILPKERGWEDLVKVERSLLKRNLNHIVRKLERKAQSSLMRIQLPKFKVESRTINLKAHLRELGLEEIFESYANFSGISNEALHVSEMVYKAMIEVDEKGSEASSVSVVVASSRSFEPLHISEQEFIVDRPFLFFIYSHATETILFMGRVTNPTIR